MRSFRITAAVLLGHVGLLAWIFMATPMVNLPGSTDNIIMASVVTEAASNNPPNEQNRLVPPAPKPTRAKPEPLSTPVVSQPVVNTTRVLLTSAPTAEAIPAPAAPSTPAAASSGSPQPAPPTLSNRSNTESPHPMKVVLPSSDADYLQNPAPPYPRMSKRMGEQGTVIIRVLINEKGHPEKAEIRSSSGYTRLDEAAMETLMKWRFVAGTRNGVAESMWFNVPIRFVLN